MVEAPEMMMKKMARKDQIDEAKKQEIEKLLPTVDLLMKNDNNFTSEILTSDKEGYNHKQVVSFFDLTNEKVSYTLYYNLGDDPLTSEDKKNPATSENISADSSLDQTSSLDSSALAPEASEETAKESTQASQDSQAKKMAKKDEAKDEEVDRKDEKEEKDEEEEKEENKTETAITFEGIAVFEEYEYKFTARTTEEVVDNETEKEFELKINKDEGSYVEVLREIETEENEVEEEYSYTVVENNQVIHSFSLEKERETEGTTVENELKLVINQEKFKFDFYDQDGTSFVDVKYDNKVDSKFVITFKKVISTQGDQEVVSFEEVTSTSK